MCFVYRSQYTGHALNIFFPLKNSFAKGALKKKAFIVEDKCDEAENAAIPVE